MRHGQFAVQLLPNLVPTVQVSQCNLSPQVHRLSGFKPLEALTDVGLGLRPVLRCPALGILPAPLAVISPALSLLFAPRSWFRMLVTAVVSHQGRARAWQIFQRITILMPLPPS